MQRHAVQERYQQGDRNFQKADLSGVNLSGLDLRESDFRGADLYGTQLVDSLLCRADFREGANLEHADLTGADLSEADLRGATLDGAQLESVFAQGALYDEKTAFPVGFDIVKAGGVDVQALERQSRIKSISQLREQTAQTQAVPPPSQPAEPAVPPSVGGEMPLAASKPLESLPPPALTTALPSSKTASSSSCLGALFGMFFVLGLGFFALNLFKSSPNQTVVNSFSTAQYPQAACGDPLPTDPRDFPVNLYPVFVNNSPETLSIIVANFCRDAYITVRKDSGIQSIQVASFTRRERAMRFAQFMTQKVGSGDIGSPTRIFQ